MTRVCTKCKGEKPESEFYSDGFRRATYYCCNACKIENGRAYRARKKLIEKSEGPRRYIWDDPAAWPLGFPG